MLTSGFPVFRAGPDSPPAPRPRGAGSSARSPPSSSARLRLLLVELSPQPPEAVRACQGSGLGLAGGLASLTGRDSRGHAGLGPPPGRGPAQQWDPGSWEEEGRGAVPMGTHLGQPAPPGQRSTHSHPRPTACPSQLPSCCGLTSATRTSGPPPTSTWGPGPSLAVLHLPRKIPISRRVYPSPFPTRCCHDTHRSASRLPRSTLCPRRERGLRPPAGLPPSILQSRAGLAPPKRLG